MPGLTHFKKCLILALVGNNLLSTLACRSKVCLAVVHDVDDCCKTAKVWNHAFVDFEKCARQLETVKKKKKFIFRRTLTINIFFWSRSEECHFPLQKSISQRHNLLRMKHRDCGWIPIDHRDLTIFKRQHIDRG